MIRAGVGFSTALSPERAAVEAAEEALQGLEGRAPQGCVAFVTPAHTPHLGRLLAALERALGSPYLVGCTGGTILGPGRELDEGPALGVLAVWSDRLRLTSLLFDTEASGDAAALAFDVGRRLQSSRGRGDLVLLWPDASAIPAARFLEGLEAALGPVPVAGAVPPLAPQGRFRQFRGSEVRRGAVSGLRLGGEARVHVAVAQGCRPLGRPHVATQTEANVILRLDGRPALEVLAETAAIVSDSPETWARVLHVGLVPNGAPADVFLARPIVGCDPHRGWLAVADRVPAGQRVWIAARDPKASVETLARTLREVASLAREVSFRFGVYFAGVGRGRRFYGRPGVEAGHLAAALPGLPWVGMAGSIELAPLAGANRVLMHSAVLVLVAE